MFFVTGLLKIIIIFVTVEMRRVISQQTEVLSTRCRTYTKTKIKRTKNMGKRQVTIERELRTHTVAIMWKLISTPGGLSRWIAEEVRQEGDQLIFVWGKPGQVHETRTAHIMQTVKNVLLRFKWDDEDDPEACTQIMLTKNDITDDLALVITDYADIDEMQGVEDMWNHDLDRLQYKTGV